MPESLAPVVGWLRKLNPALDITGIADAVWLAGYRFGGPESDDPDLPARSDQANEAPQPARDGEQPAPPTPPKPELVQAPQVDSSEPRHDIVAATADPTGARVGISARRSSRRHPAPLELGRSLRALKLQWPNGRGSQLDLDRTVKGFAATRRLVPVFRPAPERWFDVDLVVDSTGSGPVWDNTVRDFADLLQELAAFRTIRRWHMSFDRAAIRLHNPQRHEWPADQLRSANHRRLVFVLSDFTDPSWDSAKPWMTIYRWAQSTATVLVSLLPPKLRHLTAVNVPTTRARPAGPGSPNKSLRFRRPSQDATTWVPLPLVALTSPALGHWANMLMRGDPYGCDAILIPPTGLPFGPQRKAPPPAALGGNRLVELFQLLATREARNIATLSSSFSHISLPVLRFVAQTMVPTAGDEDLAEVVVSGMFTRSANPDVLEFNPGVREILQRQLMVPDVWHIHDSLTRYVTENADGSQRFAVTAGAQRATATSRPFIEAAGHVEELLRLTAPATGLGPHLNPDQLSQAPKGAGTTTVDSHDTAGSSDLIIAGQSGRRNPTRKYLIVIIPGLGGSVLAERLDGKVLWGLGSSPLNRILLNPQSLSMENAPDLRPTGLIRDQSVFPGFMITRGYDHIWRRFLKLPQVIGDDGNPARRNIDANLVAFPYDFRRSIADLAQELERQLSSRLEASKGKVVIVAHSTGGLIANYWIGQLGGWQNCRALITLGTPHRGIPKVLDYLVNGLRVGNLRLHRFSEVLNSWDSLFEFLPRYRCIWDITTNSGIYPFELPIGTHEFQARARRGYETHQAIEDGLGQLTSPPDTITFAGRGHRTISSATWDGSKLTVSATAPHWLKIDDLDGGDGTIPTVAAMPMNFSSSPWSVQYLPYRHSAMLSGAEAVDAVQEFELDGLTWVR